MFKILSIGNSFSQDSTTYLYDLAKSNGVELKVVNLYIGGCSLERHWNNIVGDHAEYEYQLNGASTDRFVSIREALLEDEWNIITMQQCSGFSGLLDTYYPFINDLSNYITENSPNAKQMIHQTWAYEIDSEHEHFVLYHSSQDGMYQALSDAYKIVADNLSLEIIPFGKVIQTLRTLPIFDYRNGGKSLCRDGFHMDYVFGRYALAATWYECVVKGNILSSCFMPPTIDEITATNDEIKAINQCVYNVVNSKVSDRNEKQ